jgi:predicted metal-dependent HD superfamily phosphohydrolase
VSSPEAALRRCWSDLGGADETVADDLLARHREPQRRYHTAVHVMWVLRHVDELVDDRVDAPVVRAAALFHDAVYDPRSTTNETDSAALASRALSPLGWAPERVRLVAELIEGTARHDPVVAAARPDAAVLFDADLAILGSSPAEYQAYVTGVRAEYGHVDTAGWRAGRAAVLRGFLERDPIYTTAAMRAARERRARANLAAELASLTPLAQ